MTPRLANVRLALSLLVLLAVTTPVLADNDHRRADIWIKYDDLPRRARETIDRERRGHDIKQILEMRRDGKTYFRALVDERGADRALFVSEGGRLLKSSDVPDVAVGYGSDEQWIKYNDLPAEEYVGVLTGVGVTEAFAEILADSDLGIARGDLLVSTGDLRRLIGRPTTSLGQAVSSAAASA